MDGVLVAYHNTARIFGFQYVPLSEMDSCIFGSEGRGDRVFEKCVQMMEAIMTEAVHQFPDQVCLAPPLTSAICHEFAMPFLKWYSPLDASQKRKRATTCCRFSLNLPTGTRRLRALRRSFSWTLRL